HDARERGGQPGAGDDDPQAAHARVLGVVGHRVRLAVRGHHANLVEDAALLELLGGGVHLLHVGLGAHQDADARGVDRHVLELELGLGLGRGLTHSAMSRRSCLPSKSITSAAAYAAVRAAWAAAPSAVTLSTRPPAVTIAPSAPRAVPAWVTSTPSGTR